MESVGEENRQFNSESSMVTKETVAGAARDFLKAVAEVAKTRLGPRPKYLQRSQWMVRTGPASLLAKSSRH